MKQNLAKIAKQKLGVILTPKDVRVIETVFDKIVEKYPDLAIERYLKDNNYHDRFYPSNNQEYYDLAEQIEMLIPELESIAELDIVITNKRKLDQ